MGTIYQCRCKECHHGFAVYDGDGMLSIGLICKTCGQRSGIPRSAPRPPRDGLDVPKFLQTTRHFSLPPIPDTEILRFTDLELANINQLVKTHGLAATDCWDDFEIKALISMKNPCQCNGLVELAAKTAIAGGPNSMTRCPSCRSDQVTAENTGGWD